MTAIRRRNTDRHSDERAMAATGGGKIRSRRYHIASKPYAKSKQVNGVAVSLLKVQVVDVTLSAVLQALVIVLLETFMACRYARGLHALLAC